MKQMEKQIGAWLFNGERGISSNTLLSGCVHELPVISNQLMVITKRYLSRKLQMQISEETALLLPLKTL